MAVSIDLSSDHLYLDGTQTVTVTSKRKSGDVQDVAKYALRRELAFKDLAGGVYTPLDAIWSLPVGQLDWDVKPGDTILDEADDEERTWTILTVAKATLGARFRCVCRDFVLAADLRDEVDYLDPVNRVDLAGSRQPDFAVKRGGLAARVQPISGAEADYLGQRGTEERFTVFLAEDVEVTNEGILRKIGDEAVTYKILAWRNKSRVDELMEIDVERLR